MRTAQKVWIDPDDWDRFVAEYFFRRIRSVQVLDASEWRHPWQTDLAWSAEAEQWTARVWPGYCLSGSGADPRVIVPETLAGEEALQRLEIAKPSEDRSAEVYLSEVPSIPLPPIKWRAIGTDAVVVSGSAGEPVPERFRRRGVISPVELDTGGDNGAVVRVSGLVEDRRQARLLRACDLVLTHDRVRSVVASSLMPGVLDVEFSQINQVSRRGPWVEIQRQYVPPGAGILDLVTGAAADPGRDELHLATLYLLSPEGEEPGSVPDETWEPSSIYRQQWNLQYRATYEDTIVEPTRISIAVPQLGFGALGARAQPIVDEINRRTAELEAALRRTENVGVFSRA
jgi:hypothetical protein